MFCSFFGRILLECCWQGSSTHNTAGCCLHNSLVSGVSNARPALLCYAARGHTYILSVLWKKNTHYFHRCTVHFEIYVVHSPTNALFINLVESFKFTLKYTIISLVHVSVSNDHHQGALSVPNWSYIYVKTVGKITSLYKLGDVAALTLHCTQHTCRSTTCCLIT